MTCVPSLVGRTATVLLLGLALPASLVGASYVLGRSFERVKLSNQTIEVKGFAEKEIVSDLASWQLVVTARGTTQAAAYQELSTDVARVQQYLEQNGAPKSEFTIGPVGSNAIHAYGPNGMLTNQIEFFDLSQSITLTSTDIARVAQLSNGVTSLLQEGVDVNSYAPQYLYTKINELKLEMLGAASRDARARAEQLATNSGGEVGALRSAQQGVFQITPANSNDVSDYGANDTSSIRKSIKAVVTVAYAIALE